MATTYAIAQTTGGTSTAPPATTAATSTASQHLTILGWVVFLLVLYALNKTGTGHELMFYGMVLIVIFLFVNNYQKILPLLTTGGQTA